MHFYFSIKVVVFILVMCHNGEIKLVSLCSNYVGVLQRSLDFASSLTSEQWFVQKRGNTEALVKVLRALLTHAALY